MRQEFRLRELRLGFIHLFCDTCKIPRLWEENLDAFIETHTGHRIELLQRKESIIA
jgi:hypothetical protein